MRHHLPSPHTSAIVYKTIIVGAFLAVNIVALPASAASIFSDSFGATAQANIPSWAESEVNPADARTAVNDPRPGSTMGHARLRLGAAMGKQVSTANFTNIQLSYYWRGDNQSEASDTLIVRWRVGNSGPFTTVATHPLNTSAWSSQEIVSLGPTAGHTAIQILFIGSTNQSNEEARVDDVEVTGTPFQAAIAGLKFEDMNGNGTRDPEEEGLPEWGFALHKIVVQEPIQTELVAMQLTGNDGGFSFNVQAPGRYRLTETIKDGWTQTAPVQSFFDVFIDLNDHGATTTTDQEGNALLFGNFKYGEIHGMKFEDLNRNGHRDDGEPGIPGWEVTLTGQTSGPRATTTDETGRYSFFDVFVDVYALTEEERVGWIATRSNPFPFTVNKSGQVVNGMDFGNARVNVIHGMKWNDKNGNGERGRGEPGLQAWKISAINLNTGVQFSTTTGAGGNYQFTDIPLGAYNVYEQAMKPWVPTTPPVVKVVLATQGQVTMVNFGNRKVPPKEKLPPPPLFPQINIPSPPPLPRVPTRN